MYSGHCDHLYLVPARKEKKRHNKAKAVRGYGHGLKEAAMNAAAASHGKPLAGAHGIYDSPSAARSSRNRSSGREELRKDSAMCLMSFLLKPQSVPHPSPVLELQLCGRPCPESAGGNAEGKWMAQNGGGPAKGIGKGSYPPGWAPSPAGWDGPPPTNPSPDSSARGVLRTFGSELLRF